MDTKLIKKYGEEILSYRLRSSRQKKRMQYEEFHKQLIQLHKEEEALYEQKRNLGWEPLVPPVQKGWKRCFVLRDDVARSKQADFFENILFKINTYHWSHRKDFIIKKRRMGRKRYVVKGQKLLEPHESHFAKLGFSEAEKQMFHEEFSMEQWSKKPVKRYVFNETWRFVLKVKPNMITRIRIKDAVLESKITTLRNYLERNDLRKQQARLISGSYQSKYWKREKKYDEKNILKNKPTLRIIDELKDHFETTD